MVGLEDRYCIRDPILFRLLDEDSGRRIAALPVDVLLPRCPPATIMESVSCLPLGGTDCSVWSVGYRVVVLMCTGSVSV